MSAEFEILNGDIIVRFEYTANATKAQATIEDASHLLWDRGWGDHGTELDPIVYDELSNQAKLDIVDVYVKKDILDMARNYLSTSGANAARDQAEQDANDNHDLGDL